jgi:diaminopimelate decarboxylase
MTEKRLPFGKEQIERIIRTHPTPFHIYDEKAIRENARALVKAFAWSEGFREFFAVKACPNPHILKILKEEGFGADCSSLAELVMADRVGIRGEMIMFTSNDTPSEEYRKARELGAVINLDDITHIAFLKKHAGLPELLSMRYNPGKLREGNAIIGKPEEAKYGFTREQLFQGYRMARDQGVKRFGLHAMIVSNELNLDYHLETARMLFDLIADLSRELGIRFEMVNLGGGFGIPYRPEQDRLDWAALGAGIRQVYEEKIRSRGLHPIRLCMECGRAITGPYGYLVSRVLHLKHTYKDYVGLDASMANLMRPALYGAYHHITVLGKEAQPADHTYDVTGSLCENNDKFAIDRKLPRIDEGDVVAIHDAGAHGYAMGFNYNGKLRSAELLLRTDGSVKLIRRAETIEDYFRTLDFSGFQPYKPQGSPAPRPAAKPVPAKARRPAGKPKASRKPAARPKVKSRLAGRGKKR